MTDEQILKLLAEIEGKEVDCTNCNGRGVYSPTGDGKDYRPCSCDSRWNPLDNPADAFALIEKYFIDITAPDPNFVDDPWIAITSIPDTSAGAHKSLSWAICLAVIEANGGMGDE